MSHIEQLKALLPPVSYARDNSLLRALLAADGAGLDAAHAAARGLASEIDPRTTASLFSEYEITAGLPDTCAGAGQSGDQRRAQLVAKWAGKGGQTAAYYTAIALRMGYVVTITEYRPHDVTSDVSAPILGALWRYAFMVHSALNTISTLTVLGTVRDPLAAWGNDALECLINHYKPAHTHAVYSYT